MTPTKESYDLYWYFANERQNIFFKRINGATDSITTDPILSTYRFTNAYRASDRVSQYLIRNVIYSGSQDIEEVFFRIILFRFFNKISTWKYLQSNLGEDIAFQSYDFHLYDSVLTNALRSGIRIYSAAYIMPSGIREFGHPKKHQNNLALLERMMRDKLPDRIADSTNLENVFILLRKYPTIGGFLAYQYAIDLAYSNICSCSESDFVVPGPGALRGIKKCFSDIGRFTTADVIRYVTDKQLDEFGARGLEFFNLFGRSLQLVDCQNLFCELDKYLRVYSPAINGFGRSRIKQKFRLNPDTLKLFYPPKWGINESIPQALLSLPNSTSKISYVK